MKWKGVQRDSTSDKAVKNGKKKGCVEETVVVRICYEDGSSRSLVHEYVYAIETTCTTWLFSVNVFKRGPSCCLGW